MAVGVSVSIGIGVSVGAGVAVLPGMGVLVGIGVSVDVAVSVGSGESPWRARVPNGCAAIIRVRNAVIKSIPTRGCRDCTT